MTDSEHGPVDCGCYRCAGPIYEYTEDGHRYVVNDLHVELCDDCGRVKTEHVDLGTRGYYECWWCTERAAGPFGPNPAPPTAGFV